MTWSRVKPRSQVHDAAHAKARKAAALAHRPSDPCARCGHPLGPMGPHLHLDHHDSDKRVYLGFSHGTVACPICRVKCNLAAAANLGRQRQKATREGTGASRRPRAPRTWGRMATRFFGWLLRMTWDPLESTCRHASLSIL